jgi:aspartate/methionine/tyrosine aminotransferase
MRWAKTRPRVTYDLASSGLVPVTTADLLGDTAAKDAFEISGPNDEGYVPLREAIARRYQVDAECVSIAAGASGANFLACLALVGGGDDVLVERPAYDPLIAAARIAGANVIFFDRGWDSGFALDADAVKSALTLRTKLIVLSNAHNPSGALASTQVLSDIGQLAARARARVLVDEVYAEAQHDDAPMPWPAARLGDVFVTTSSLTKAYGLAGLRCGWVLAEPDLARRMWRINDLFASVPAHPAERLSAIALDHLPMIAARARALLEENRGIWNQFLEARADMVGDRLEGGTTTFPRLERGNVEELCARLRDRYETTVVPGRFFEMPEHFRVAIGCPTETLRQGLERLAAVLAEAG